MTQALQQKYVAGNVNEPASARFLLVSDIHGANQYALMRTIIKEEDIDAVIDSGDLVNFGRVQEGDAAGLYRSIQSLGVPYIFTSGNHDQSSASDRAVLARLARIPNVVLLEDAAGSLREVTFHGLRITGFNDPRWFGDDNADPTAKEKPAADRYNAAVADQPEPDIVVTHEPYAAEQVERGRLLVNGHMHTPAIEGNRIQVGTFTGGGVVSHYSEGPGQELDGQPYSFDIAQFGTSCELTSLTRYSFRNLLEGRPAYDNVQVISGARIDPYRPPASTAQQPGQDQPDPARRICSRIDETTMRALPLAPGDPARRHADLGRTVPGLPSALELGELVVAPLVLGLGRRRSRRGRSRGHAARPGGSCPRSSWAARRTRSGAPAATARASRARGRGSSAPPPRRARGPGRGRCTPWAPPGAPRRVPARPPPRRRPGAR